MSFVDKMRGKSQVGKGRARQWVGRATGRRATGRRGTGRRGTQARGLTDQIMGRARQLAGRLKDAGKDIRKSLSH